MAIGARWMPGSGPTRRRLHSGRFMRPVHAGRTPRLTPFSAPVKANQRETPTASGEGGRGVAGRSFPAENRRGSHSIDCPVS